MDEYVSGRLNSLTTLNSTKCMTSFTSTKLEEKALWTEWELTSFFILSIIFEMISLSEKKKYKKDTVIVWQDWFKKYSQQKIDLLMMKIHNFCSILIKLEQNYPLWADKFDQVSIKVYWEPFLNQSQSLHWFKESSYLD